jgi:hypothetical protein
MRLCIAVRSCDGGIELLERLRPLPLVLQEKTQPEMEQIIPWIRSQRRTILRNRSRPVPNTNRVLSVLQARLDLRKILALYAKRLLHWAVEPILRE